MHAGTWRVIHSFESYAGGLIAPKRQQSLEIQVHLEPQEYRAVRTGCGQVLLEGPAETHPLQQTISAL